MRADNFFKFHFLHVLVGLVLLNTSRIGWSWTRFNYGLDTSAQCYERFTAGASYANGDGATLHAYLRRQMALLA